ncbi:hypothetical protein MPSEU_000135400 [Mayamaea pseudoterrestris]|nr:hypothetical protein MPSEU_000135400 [Mayamaea pseudoterrestris]
MQITKKTQKISSAKTKIVLSILPFLSVVWMLTSSERLRRSLKTSQQQSNANARAPPLATPSLSETSNVCSNYTPSHEPFNYPLNASAVYNNPLPLPIKVMHEYMQQHSVQALQNDPHPERRKYAIAFHLCPLSGGNNAHRFFNGVLWSILTNRTVLYKYFTKEMCLQYGLDYYTKAFCKLSNEQCECDQILTKAPWMPMYDDWSHLFESATTSSNDNHQTTVSEAYMVPFHATMMGFRRDSPRFPLPDNYQDLYGVDLVSKYPQPLVIFPFCYMKMVQLGDRLVQETQLKSDWARQRVRDLYSLGPDFMYGMLHKYIFQFTRAATRFVPPLLEQVNQQYYTVGLHSRHRFQGLDGCDISREIKCLTKIMEQRTDGDAALPVQVRIMSDRPCTVASLTKWLEQRNHSILFAQHDEASPSRLQEHGPYAGMGFFQDLALVSSARSAIVAMRRSSSDLLRELMFFNRGLERWLKGEDIMQLGNQTLDNCVLPYQADPGLSVGNGNSLVVTS